VDSLRQIAEEIRGRVSKMSGTPEQKREELLMSLLTTYHSAEMAMALEIILSPEVGFAFAYKVNESLGAVNEVVFKEFGMEPFHIKEMDLATVKTIEDVTGYDIDTVLQDLRG
jgi:hypothetical protein